MAPTPSDHDLHGGFDPEKHRREIELMEQRFRERAAELEEGGDSDERVSDEMREFFGASAERLESIVPQLQDHGTAPDLVETTGEIRRSVDSFFDTAEAHDLIPEAESPAPAASAAGPEPKAEPAEPAAPAAAPTPTPSTATPSTPAPAASDSGSEPGKKMDLKTALERLRRGVPMSESSPPTPPPGPSPFAQESPRPAVPAVEPGGELRPPGIPPQDSLKAPSTNQLPRVASVESIETDGKDAPLSQKIDPGLVDKARQGMTIQEIEKRMKSQGPGFQAEEGALRPSDAGVEGARRSDEPSQAELDSASGAEAAAGFDEVFDELEELVRGSLGDETQAYLHNLQNPQPTIDLPVPQPLEDSYSFTEEQAQWFQQERDKLNQESDPGLGKEEGKSSAKGYLADKLEDEVKQFRPTAGALGRIGAVPPEALQPGPRPGDDPKETVAGMTPVQIMEEIRMIRRIKAALLERGVITAEDMEKDEEG